MKMPIAYYWDLTPDLDSSYSDDETVSMPKRKLTTGPREIAYSEIVQSTRINGTISNTETTVDPTNSADAEAKENTGNMAIRPNNERESNGNRFAFYHLLIEHF